MSMISSWSIATILSSILAAEVQRIVVEAERSDIERFQSFFECGIHFGQTAMIGRVVARVISRIWTMLEK